MILKSSFFTPKMERWRYHLSVILCICVMKNDTLFQLKLEMGVACAPYTDCDCNHIHLIEWRRNGFKHWFTATRCHFFRGYYFFLLIKIPSDSDELQKIGEKNLQSKWQIDMQNDKKMHWNSWCMCARKQRSCRWDYAACVIINKVDRATGITIHIKFQNVWVRFYLSLSKVLLFFTFVRSLLILFMRSINSLSLRYSCTTRAIIG